MRLLLVTVLLGVSAAVHLAHGAALAKSGYGTGRLMAALIVGLLVLALTEVRLSHGEPILAAADPRFVASPPPRGGEP
jgi:hypothetical protein